MAQPPNNVTQSVVGVTEITVSWDEPSDTGAINEYEVQVREDGGAFTTAGTVTVGTSTFTYDAAAETNKHTFRVRSIGDGDTSQYITTASVRTDPINFAVTTIDGDEITVAWDGARDADGYEVTLSPVRRPPRGETATLARGETQTATRESRTITVGPDTTTTTLAVDKPGRNKIDVRATYDGGQNSQRRTVRATTPRVIITERNATDVTIKWGYDLQLVPTGFTILRTNRSLDAPAQQTIGTASGTDRTFTDDSVSPGREYEYEVVANTE